VFVENGFSGEKPGLSKAGAIRTGECSNGWLEKIDEMRTGNRRHNPEVGCGGILDKDVWEAGR